MKREDAIVLIEKLYPADAQCKDTATLGKQLLTQAKREVESWRTEPTPVLVRYAELCLRKESNGQ